MNIYQKTAKDFQKKIEKDVREIYKSHKNELILKLVEENLLEFAHNSIESSTAIGYCLEEFIIKKLRLIDKDFYKRDKRSTQNSSYDLYAYQNNVKILINLKANKKNNNAISALGKLYDDYVLANQKQKKLFLIFKTNYLIKDMKIKIRGIESFYLEQCNFDLIKTDNRSWSKDNNNLSGRIQYNSKKDNLNLIEYISYENTIENLKKWIKIKKLENKS